MNIDNNDKALLLNGGAVTLSNIRLLDGEGHEFLITDDDYLSEWNYEDYRYVPENGFIGQFVERIFDGVLLGMPTDVSLEGKEIKPTLGIQDIHNATTNYYDMGTFIITSIGEKDKTGSSKFQSSDYAKKFNILYKDFGKYPCLSIELLNNVCEQVGVPYDSNGMCWCYAVTEDGLQAGPHCFNIDDTYYNFELDDDLVLNDALMYIESTNKLIQRRVVVEDDEYKVIRTEIPFETTSSSTVHQLLGSYIPYYDFTNNDFVVRDNQFDEDELCRDVVKAVAKLAYTWARIGIDDKLHLDFTKKNVQDVDEYDIINTDRYYDNVTTGDTLIPINKVLIGMSQVNGENVFATSEDYTEETESTIRIYDNPLTHNELLRKIALNGCEKLFGLTYTPITINTIGHPWLEGDSYIKLEDINERTLYTYSFNRKLTYKGYINSTITSIAENQVKQTYEYNKNQLYKITKTQVDVDKANNRIDLLTSRVEGDEEEVTNVKLDIGSIQSSVTKITDEDLPSVRSEMTQVTQTMNNIQNLFQITGGSNLIKNSAFLLDDETWEFTDIGSGAHYHTPLGQGYDASVIGTVISKGTIQLKNCKMTSKTDEDNIEILSLNTDHSFTYSYKLDEDTTGHIILKNAVTDEVVYEEELEPTSRITKIQFPPKAEEGEEQQRFLPTNTSYILEISSTATYDGSLYIYDLMLNSGDIKSWEPSSGEISSTILRMSTYGLQVTSTGSNITTLMSAGGFSIYKGEDITGTPVTNFDDTGLQTGVAETTKVTIKKYVMDELQLDGTEHHVEYFKE